MWNAVARREDDDEPPQTNEDHEWVYPLETIELARYGLDHYHVAPFAGGWLEQPEALIDDILEYDARMRFVEWEYDREQQTQKDFEHQYGTVKATRHG